MKPTAGVLPAAVVYRMPLNYPCLLFKLLTDMKNGTSVIYPHISGFISLAF